MRRTDLFNIELWLAIKKLPRHRFVALGAAPGDGCGGALGRLLRALPSAIEIAEISRLCTRLTRP
jgi:hypothetical protein